MSAIAMRTGILILVLGVFVWSRYNEDFLRSFLFENSLDGRITIFVDEIPVRVTVSDTAVERAQGLSGRKILERGEGMLFIFEEEGTPGFWMKDMQFAIDIIWISTHNKIVDIDKVVTPDSYPVLFSPHDPVKFVLEVPAGFTDMNNIKIGSHVELEMVY